MKHPTDEQFAAMPRKFREQVDLGEEPEDCWFWEGRVHHGAALYSDRKFRANAQRYTWLMCGGDEPRPMNVWLVRAACGNKLCVRPEHLKIVKRGGGDA